MTNPPEPGPDLRSGRHEAWVVGPGQTGRLDRFLSDSLGVSRTRAQRLVADGRVQVDGRGAKKSERVEPGTTVEVLVPPPEPVEIGAEDIPIDIVYEDSDLVVVNKPAGMVVHPAPGHRTATLVNALLHHVRDLSGVGGRLRPGIVHRLDRDTSGLLVVAKTDAAHLALSADLKDRRVKRLYLTAAWGHLASTPLTIDAPVGRDPRHRQRMAVVDGGRHAVTRVRVRRRWPRAELLDVSLHTGRTHQIRVHLAHVGHPVVGDGLYGAGWERGMGGARHGWASELARRVPRQFLHAAELILDHPRTRRRLGFRAPLPPDLSEVRDWADSGD